MATNRNWENLKITHTCRHNITVVHWCAVVGTGVRLLTFNELVCGSVSGFEKFKVASVYSYENWFGWL
ncbi:MAG: hypothetical protein LBJ00_07400 [Planctomycetaceae bacterium]|nr:hypothetical protein [Planctomycetaceae bacterium]